jgi:ubiquinol-cytochrome c reductase cytochrome c subunit
MRFTTIATVAMCAITALLANRATDTLAETTASPTTPVGNAVRGKAAFLKYGCYECHGTMGQGNNFSGPTLAPNPIPYAAIIIYIRHPSGQMPAQSAKIVPDAVVADISAYLESIPATPKVGTIHALSGISTAPSHER